jgi:hypothetical protein
MLGMMTDAYHPSYTGSINRRTIFEKYIKQKGLEAWLKQ